jgi:secreted trypsin-like serine protease
LDTETVLEPVTPMYGVVNETLASLRDFSHLVTIGWTRSDGTGVDWKCAGSLITLKAVLTGAQCLNSEGKAPDIVRMGDKNLNSPFDNQFAQELRVESVIRHPNYKRQAFYNDIGLILLDGDVVVNDNVAPACLWRQDQTELKAELEVASWSIRETSLQNQALMRVMLRPVSNNECSKYYGQTRRLKNGIQPTQLCTVDSCLLDGGGPLEMKLLSAGHLTPFIVGITSFGKDCHSEGPTVFTRVSSYIDWIEQSLNHTDRNECKISI